MKTSITPGEKCIIALLAILVMFFVGPFLLAFFAKLLPIAGLIVIVIAVLIWIGSKENNKDERRD